jgi:small-conductance mechanosensitive channel
VGEAAAALLEGQIASLKGRYFRSVLIPVALMAAIVLLYLLISRTLLPAVLDRERLFVSRRLGTYLVWMVLLIVAVVFFLEDLKAIATVMGIIGAAVVIALQDLCSSFAGWFVIVTSGKIRMGDRVEIDGRRGEVIDIQMLRTTLAELNNWLEVDEPTGRTLIIPNSFIFKSHVFNYSHVHPHIWGKVDITVTFETPVKKAYDVLLQALTEETREEFEAAAAGGRRMEARYGVLREAYQPKIHTFIADSGICFSLFYVAHYREFTVMRDRLMLRVAEEFNRDPELQFAYPTERHIPTAAAGELAVTVKREAHDTRVS